MLLKRDLPSIGLGRFDRVGFLLGYGVQYPNTFSGHLGKLPALFQVLEKIEATPIHDIFG